MRLPGMAEEVDVPKLDGPLVKSSPPWAAPAPGSLKLGWLNRLKKSAESSPRTRSVIVICLPSLKSRFQLPKPRNGLSRPDVLSDASRTGRNSVKTYEGLLKRLTPCAVS